MADLLPSALRILTNTYTHTPSETGPIRITWEGFVNNLITIHHSQMSTQTPTTEYKFPTAITIDSETITTIEADILSIQRGLIVHQVNCFGKCGGLAKAIFDKYPIAHEHYQAMIARETENGKDRQLLLGDAQTIRINQSFYVVNLFGQYDVSRSKPMTEIGFLGVALGQLRKEHDNIFSQNFPIFFPHRLGCGLGGGNWDEVYRMLNVLFRDHYICKPSFIKG